MHRQDRRFDAFELSASHGALEGALNTAALERLGDRVAESGAATEGEIRWTIRGGNDRDGRPAITVALDGSVPLVCQRCLGPLDLAVHQSTTLLLARTDAELVKLDGVSEQEVVLANAPLDPLALVEDELLLSLPFAPRHEASCGAGENAAPGTRTT